MASFRHVGSESAILDTPHSFTRFGQKAEMDEQFAHERIADGLPLLPEAKWAEIGITDKELTDYPMAQQHSGAPAVFQEKKRKALLALHDFRESLKAGLPQPDQARAESKPSFDPPTYVIDDNEV